MLHHKVCNSANTHQTRVHVHVDLVGGASTLTLATSRPMSPEAAEGKRLATLLDFSTVILRVEHGKSPLELLLNFATHRKDTSNWAQSMQIAHRPQHIMRKFLSSAGYTLLTLKAYQEACSALADALVRNMPEVAEAVRQHIEANAKDLPVICIRGPLKIRGEDVANALRTACHVDRHEAYQLYVLFKGFLHTQQPSKEQAWSRLGTVLRMMVQQSLSATEAWRRTLNEAAAGRESLAGNVVALIPAIDDPVQYEADCMKDYKMGLSIDTSNMGDTSLLLPNADTEAQDVDQLITQRAVGQSHSDYPRQRGPPRKTHSGVTPTQRPKRVRAKKGQNERRMSEQRFAPKALQQEKVDGLRRLRGELNAFIHRKGGLQPKAMGRVREACSRFHLTGECPHGKEACFSGSTGRPWSHLCPHCQTLHALKDCKKAFSTPSKDDEGEVLPFLAE